MKILRASEMGFCFGVRRGVDMMQDSLRQDGPMVSLGSVVHNPQVVDGLREEGLEVIHSAAEAADRTVAITAHGVGPEVIATLEAQDTRIVDTTCPIVTRSQQWARRLSEEGFAVIIFGDPDHKEVRGVRTWAEGNVQTLASEDDITLLPEDFPSRVGVLSQTTETESHFASFVKKLLEVNMDRISELRVLNTLCHATTSQQSATIQLAGQVSLMIVVGGRESANTRHLAAVSREWGVETHHVETAAEIDPAWLRQDLNLSGTASKEELAVGVTAGASTPDSIIDEVIERLRELGNQL